jgi:hypothetical protein
VTNTVSIPPHMQWLVWFCDVDMQPYESNESWCAYLPPGGLLMIVGDMEPENRQERLWGRSGVLENIDVRAPA